MSGHDRAICDVRFVPGQRARLQRLYYADAISKVGSCSTLNDTEARDKAFLGGSIVQAARDVLIRSSCELGVVATLILLLNATKRGGMQ
jgi:hypothetical protein